jgi:hypothetical protein
MTTQVMLKTSRDFYGPGIAVIKRYKALANAKLNEINSELTALFGADRQHGKKDEHGDRKEMAVSTVNACGARGRATY